MELFHRRRGRVSAARPHVSTKCRRLCTLLTFRIQAAPSHISPATAQFSHLFASISPLPIAEISSPPHIMFAIRNLARTAPRSIARLSTKAVRPQPSAFTKVSAFQPAWSRAPKLTAAFHVSAVRREDGGGRTIQAPCGFQANWVQSTKSSSQSSRMRSLWRRT
jgi:hypothetical protein